MQENKSEEWLRFVFVQYSKCQTVKRNKRKRENNNQKKLGDKITNFVIMKRGKHKQQSRAIITHNTTKK